MNLKNVKDSRKKVADAITGPTQHTLQVFKQSFPGEKALKFGQYTVKDQSFLAVQLDAPQTVDLEGKQLQIAGAVRQGNKVLVCYKPADGENWASMTQAQDLFNENNQ